jgi:uncharacterized protein (DUF1778 family)
VIEISVTAVEHRAIEQAAARAGKSMEEWLLELALRLAH